MNRVCILGIGSPAGDDRAGWLTIDALIALGMKTGNDFVIEKLDRPGANLIPLLESAAWVILIDAMQSHGPIGRIQHFGEEDWPVYCQGVSSHGFGVLNALSLARELGNLPSRLDVYGIEISSASPDDEAGSAIQFSAQQLARQIANKVTAA